MENLYQYLSPEDAATHKRLTYLLERAESPAPLTVREIAELCGISEEGIRQIQRRAEYKVKKQIITKYPDLLRAVCEMPPASQ
jgi:DNA-directed RNA polymerase sigma subunit (sigma70/sigma32)